MLNPFTTLHRRQTLHRTARPVVIDRDDELGVSTADLDACDAGDRRGAHSGDVADRQRDFPMRRRPERTPKGLASRLYAGCVEAHGVLRESPAIEALAAMVEASADVTRVDVMVKADKIWVCCWSGERHETMSVNRAASPPWA